MTLEELKKLSTKELLALYNQYAEKHVNRMASRAKLEERTKQILEDNGKLDKPLTDKEARNIRETAKAGVNTDSAKEMAKTKAPKGGKAAKPPKAPKEATSPAAPVKGKGAGTGKGEKAAKSRGAPTKNPTYLAIPEGTKGYNPKNFRTNANSARFKVLEFIRKAPTGRTREQCEAHFSGQDVNVISSLYFLAKYGFAKVKED